MFGGLRLANQKKGNKMSTKKKKELLADPDWQKQEKIITEIQKQLAPQAEVKHNQKIIGNSGRRRQLDVTISQKIGAIPVFIVIECKRYSRKVGIEKVEAFVTKLWDVNASRGVMISNTGFDAGAIAMAEKKNIILRTYRGADETDWKKLVGDQSWIQMVRTDIENIRATAKFENNIVFDVPVGTMLFDSDGQPFSDDDGVATVKKFAIHTWMNADRPRPIGEIESNIELLEPAIFVRDEKTGRLLRVFSLVVRAKVLARLYAVNFQMEQGKVIEDTQSQDLEYVEATTIDFDWQTIMNAQEGIELDAKAWEEREKESLSRIFREVDLDTKSTYRVKIFGGTGLKE